MPALPIDRSREAGGLPQFSTLDCTPGAPLGAALHTLSRRHGVSVSTTLLTALGVLLMRLSGEEKVAIDTCIAGRVPGTLCLRAVPDSTVSHFLGKVARATATAAPDNPAPDDSAPGPQIGYLFEASGYRIPAACRTAVAGCDLAFLVQADGATLALTCHYDTTLFDRSTVARYAGQWCTLLESMADDDEQRIGELALLTAPEREQILVQWNATASDYMPGRCVHELFETLARAQPQASAVVYEGGTVSYGALNARTNRLARRLQAAGVTPGAAVAVMLERSLDLIVAQIAVLKCGAAYVPIDPAFPLERRQFMLADTAAVVVIGRACQEVVHGVIDVGDTGTGAADDLGVPCTSENPAYIMYTSGSSGRAKGVVVPHRAINRLVLNNGYARFDADDRIAFAANPAFDASTMEVWAPLLNGGCCVVVVQDVLLDAQRFDAALRGHGVTVLWMTVGLFNQFAEQMAASIAALRYLIVGGEALNPAAIAGVLRRGGPRHLINGYGPTETTTFAITHEITEVSPALEAIPLGRPIGNTQVYILDPRGQPVPVGVRGEIYIGGHGVALGYLNRPDLSEERFVPDTFAQAPHARMYRTGDLGKWRPEGTVDYLGRNDSQIKIRGFRIETGEIEARLAAQPAVRGAAVLAREDVPGEKQLVAYVALDAGDRQAVIAQLRIDMASAMPGYMLPVAYVALDRLPLTPNGKLDRRALPVPDARAYAVNAYEAPEGETESALAAIWCALLGFERVGRHDNFFGLGGHSLFAARMVTRIRENFDIELPLASVFAAPVLSALAEQIVDAQLAQFDPGELEGILASSQAA